MLKLRTLEFSPQSVVYELPPGKPDCRLPCIEGSEERPRVLQSSQKGGTCTYYAINLIRRRIGSSPTTEALKIARDVEQICSLWRKKITRFELEFPFSWAELKSEKAKRILSLNQAAIAYHLRSGGAKRDACALSEKRGNALQALFQAFLDQNQHVLFHAFLRAEYLSQSMENNRWLLSRIGPLCLQNLENQWKEEKISDPELQELHLTKLATGSVVKSYGLAHSAWNPNAGIKNLILNLKAKGPIAVFGHLGCVEYMDPPQKLSFQFADREVFGWKIGSRKQNDPNSGHAVVLVGAKYEGSIEQVYYVDSNDPSDPANPALQRIYAISYKTLVAGLRNVFGEPALEIQAGFAYTGNFQIERV